MTLARSISLSREPLRRFARLAALSAVVLLPLLLGRLAAVTYFATTGTTPYDLPAPASLHVNSVVGEEHELILHNRSTPLVLLVLSAECKFCNIVAPEWARFLNSLNPAAIDVALLSRSNSQETLSFASRWGLRGTILLIEAQDLAALGLGGYPGSIVVMPQSDRLSLWTGTQPRATFDRILVRLAEFTAVDPALDGRSGS